MFLSSTNIFCQPTAALTDIAAIGVEWSLDGVTYQTGPAPAGVLLYFTITAPHDFSDATFVQFVKIGVGGPAFVATGADGSVTCVTGPGGIPSADRLVTVTAPSGDLDIGILTFA